MAKRRHIKVDGTDARIVAIIAVGAAVSVVLAGPSPTGYSFVDVVLVAVASAGAVWLAATAPWWAVTMLAGVAAALAPGVWLTALGLATLALGLWVGVRRRSLPWLRALVAALSLTVLARAGHQVMFGFTAALGIGAAVAVAVLGLRRSDRRTRAIVRTVLAVAAAGTAAIAAAFALGVAMARPDLEEGNRQARTGMDRLGRGDLDGARVAFARAEAAFERADGDIGRLWVQPVRLVPFVAQHHRSADELTHGAVRATRIINRALAEVDLDGVRLVDGRIDIAAIEALEAPLVQLNTALAELDDAVARAANPWLVDPLQRRLRDLAADVAEQRARGATAVRAVQQAPALLGRDEPRRYFVAFTTPAEARGLGGFMGNYAELTIAGGKIEMTGFGRHSDLNEAGDPATKTLTGPADFLARWGRFGFDLPPGGRVAPDAWSDLTLSPHFPHVAEVIAQLYPQSGGRQVDGVFALDVYALAALMELTGPLDIDGLDEPLTSANAARYLLYDQYLTADNDARIDRLEDVARTAVERLLGSDLPPPPDIARLLGPLAAEGRLLAWAKRPDEQALFTGIHMDGALPPLDGGDGFTFALNNTVGNKIDAYLQGTLRYQVEVDRDGTVRSQAVLTLTNTAPATGLPKYVIGNLVGLPPGTNRTYLSFYSAFPHTSVTVDGEPAALASTTEAGWIASSMYLTWAPGQTHTVVVTFEGRTDTSHGVHTFVRQPATVAALSTEVEVLGEQPLRRRTDAAGRIELLVGS